MDRLTFLNLVSNPEKLTSADVEALEQVAQSFPYCQTTYILLAKASHNSGSMMANKKLKTAAAYAANRSILKKIINNEWENEKAETILETNLVDVEASVLIPSNEEIEIPEITTNQEPIIDSIVINETVQVEDIIVNEVVSEETIQVIDEKPVEEQKLSIADEIAANLLYWHEMRKKAAEFLADDSTTKVQEIASPEMSNEVEETTIETQEPEINFVENIISETYQEEDTFPFKTTLTEVPLAYDVIETSQTFGSIISEEPQITETPFFEIVEEKSIDEVIVSETFVEEPIVETIPVLPVEPSIIYYFDKFDFKNIHTEAELDNNDENELLLEYILSVKKDKKKRKIIEPAKSETQDEIIDKFIKLKPGISRVSKQEISNLQSNNKDLSKKSTTPNSDIVSETLAKIMVKQNKILPAIEMYHKLILKYPEKKVYFAGIIKSLEEK